MRGRDLVTMVAGAAALVAAVFILGGGPRTAQAVVAALVAISLGGQVWSRRSFERVSPLLAMLGIAAGLSALQLMPLPAGLIGALEPVNSSLREDGASLLDLSPYQSLSVDPPATLRCLAFFIILLGIAAVALRFAITEKGRYRLIVLVALVCAAVALTVGIHSIFGLTRLYGIYELEEAHPSVLGPLLNENHLGCLLAMGTVLSFSLAMYRRQRSWVRTAWVVATAACGMATVASQSRGAALALVVGGIVCAGILVGQRLVGENLKRKRRPNFIANSLPIAVVAACAVIVMIYAGAGGVSDQIGKTTFAEVNAPKSKFSAWKSGVHLVEESPWVGVGRGAQESTFTRVHPASSYATYAYVENEYVQAVVDWGIPGAVLLALAGLWVLGIAIRRWSDGPLAGGALGAVAVVMIQSNVDFGLELLGVAVPITIVAATLTYMPLREVSGKALLRGRGVRALHVAGLGLAAALLLSNATKPLSEDHDDLRAKNDPTLADVRSDLERHPLDYYGYAVASQIMARKGDSQTVRLLNHAMRLHPTHSGLHVTAARMLYRSKRMEQATVEYAAALRGSSEPRKIVEEIVTVFPKELAASALPADYHPPDTMIIMLQEMHHIDVAMVWLQRVLDLQPGSLQACELLYSLSLQTRDLDSIASAMRRCPNYEPSHDSQLQLAQLLMSQHAYKNVIVLLKDVETWQGLVADKTAAWLALCDAYRGLAQWDDARRCLRRLDASGFVGDRREIEIVKRIDQINLERRATDLHQPVP